MPPGPTLDQTPDEHHGRVDRAFEALARTTVRLRWVIVPVWILAVVVCVSALPSLSSAVKAQQADFLPKDTPSIKASNLATPFLAKNAASVALVAGRNDTPLTTADQRALLRLAAKVQADPDVHDVRNQGISADGKAVRLLVEFGPKVGFNGDAPVFDRLHADLRNAELPAGLQAHLAGQLAQAADTNKANQDNNRLTEQLSVLFIIVLLLIVFRAALAPLITLIPAGLSLAIAGPLIGEVAKAGVEVSALTQILLTVIVLGAGTDYGLFLIYRVREEIAAGREPRDAVVYSLSRVGETITFSAACVVFALLSLVFAEFGLYRGLGPGLAIGIAVVLVAGLTLMPALLAIFGRAAFWPSQPRSGVAQQGVWGRIAASVVDRPQVTLGAGVALFVALALGLLAYKPAGFGDNPAPAGSDSAKGEAILDAHFPAAVRNPTNVLFRVGQSAWDDPAIVARGQDGLTAEPPFASIIGGLSPNGTAITPAALSALYHKLGPPQALAPTATAPPGVPGDVFAAYRAASQFISADGHTIQYYASLHAGDAASTAALNAVPEVRRSVEAVAHRLGVGPDDQGVAGQAPIAYDVSKISTRDLQVIIPIVAVVILLLLIVLLRSLIAPLYLIASVILSYLAAVGFAIIVFVVIAGEDGLNFVLPFFLFVFLVALGSDYNILVMTRIREEARRMPLHDAVRTAIAATGSTVTSAGLVLAGTFTVLTVAAGGQAREIGLGLAAGVLLDTFLVRTLLIPATVVLVGRRSWWPSKLALRD